MKLKDPKEWTLIGTRQRRFDVPDKVTGKPIYAIDVRLPNMLYAAIVQCPVFKGRLKAVDATTLAGMKGVHRVVKQPDAVAVVADSWWRAKKAAAALAVTWDAGGDDREVSSATIQQNLHGGLAASDARIGRNDGDCDRALAQAVKRIAADYEVPFLGHATMEPQNCTAHVTADGVEIWAPTQDGETALAIAADAAGVPPSKVVVHKMMLGCGFGRRGIFQDFIRQAVLIAKEVDQPVKLVWTREEDIRHDFYRPVAAARMTAGLDAGGMPIGWTIRTAGQSIIAAVSPRVMQFGVDRNFLQGLLEDMPYDVPNYRVDYAMRNTHVPVGVWRSVNHSQNAFFKESFVDEMAHAAGTDPYLFRRKLLAKQPKELAVLDAAARRAEWGSALPNGVFRGIALHGSQNSICAQVVEASVGDDGKVRVHRVVSAIDAGHVVNPLTRRNADRERDRLRAHRGAVRGNHHHAGPGGAVELPRLPDAASGRDAAGGDRHPGERRVLGWRRGNARASARACFVQRRFRGDRQAHPFSAAQKPRFEERITETNGGHRHRPVFGRPDMSATRIVTAAALVFILIGHASAAGPADAPPGALSCSGCHPAGRVDSMVPRLVGRNPADIVAAMQAFKSGQRPSTVMGRIAKGFSEDEVRAIAAWYGASKD